MSDINTLTKDALDQAYKAQTIKLYSVLAQALLSAKSDEEKAGKAISRFRKGLEKAKLAHQKALEASNTA